MNRSRRRLALLGATTTAVAALAALPATGSARPPEPPPEGCIATTSGVFCIAQVEQLGEQALTDPVGAVNSVGALVNHVVCYSDVEICPPPEG